MLPVPSPRADGWTGLGRHGTASPWSSAMAGRLSTVSRYLPARQVSVRQAAADRAGDRLLHSGWRGGQTGRLQVSRTAVKLGGSLTDRRNLSRPAPVAGQAGRPARQRRFLCLKLHLSGQGRQQGSRQEGIHACQPACCAVRSTQCSARSTWLCLTCPDICGMCCSHP